MPAAAPLNKPGRVIAWAMRRAVLLLFLLLHGTPAPAASLYEASTIVTGMDARSRPDGLRRILATVLARAGGDPDLAEDPRLATLDPMPLLRGFAYLDRMSDIPRHDEQGSRDRPFDLVARFDPDGIDAVLRGWGARPWAEPRPALVIRIGIQPRRGAPFPLRADTDPDERHRAALLAAARQFGVDLVLPAVLDDPPVPSGAPVLSGALRWSDADAGWNGIWSLGDETWSSTGTSFDAAYRAALGGAVRRLSAARAGP